MKTTTIYSLLRVKYYWCDNEITQINDVAGLYASKQLAETSMNDAIENLLESGEWDEIKPIKLLGETCVSRSFAEQTYRGDQITYAIKEEILYSE